MDKTVEKISDDFDYIEFGKKNTKSTILILHGWSGSSDSWLEVGKLLEKEAYRIIIPNLPGSSKIELKREYTLTDCAELVEDLIKKLKLKNIILLGHSNGGAISIKLSVRGNIKIKKLILNNSAGIRNDKKRLLKRKILNTISKGIKPIKNIKVLNNLRTIFYRAIGSQDYLKVENNPNLKQTYLNMIDSDLQKEMKTINNKTLLIWGEKDRYTPLSDGKKINNLIKKSKLIILDNERHGIHLQNPDRLVSIIKESL